MTILNFPEKEQDDILQHYGVKGMKWGVRRTAKQLKTAFNDKRASLKREDDWRKADITSMSNQELKRHNNRLRMENDLKRISKTTLKTKEVKKDYIHRGKLSDDVLKKKVERYKLMDNYTKESNRAAKDNDKRRERRNKFAMDLIKASGAVNI